MPKCVCGATNYLSLAQGLEIQSSDLLKWRVILKPAYYKLLVSVVREVTAKRSLCGHAIPRGCNLRDVVIMMSEIKEGKKLVQLLDRLSGGY